MPSVPMTPAQLQQLLAGSPPTAATPQSNEIGLPGSRGSFFAKTLQTMLVDQGGVRAFYSQTGELLGAVPFVEVVVIPESKPVDAIPVQAAP